MVRTALTHQIARAAHSSPAARVWHLQSTQPLIQAVSGVLVVARVGNALDCLTIVIRRTRAPKPRIKSN